MFGIPGDDQALKTWRAALPGYEVLGFKADSQQSDWRYSDALHCRTRAIWDQKMLFMAHKRLTGVVPATAKCTIDVQIRDYSNAGLVENKLHLFWKKTSATKWNMVALQPALAAKKFTYRASIEGIQPGQAVEYYLAATSQSGRSETLPRVAPKGYYTFTVEQKR
jgi:hypothetical protein